MSYEAKTKEEKTDEAFGNLAGFFDLAFRIAIREGIDIGQFENKNKEKYD